ncbi:uncharacterized protein LOC141914251 [Tubulanus polymorphus]|uniref:uncharacterized protein LOC141914251 n=1 Tax=Tubulanus polymorphus TaxID=672921 RepID=UPI003DA65AF3
MQRARHHHGGSTFPNDVKASIPFLKEFCDGQIKSDENITSTRELHMEFVAWLKIKTCEPKLIDIGKGFQRFSRQLSTEAGIRGWKYCSHKQRSYMVQTTKVTRHRSADIKNDDVGEKRQDVKLEYKFICKEKGHGAISSRFIKAGEFICEYKGMIIREKVYQRNGEIVTMYDMGNNLWLDGSRDKNGTLLAIEDNPGAYLNHSKLNANCIIKNDGNNTLEVYAKYDIPPNHELLHNYGDRRRNLPQWIYK